MMGEREGSIVLAQEHWAAIGKLDYGLLSDGKWVDKIKVEEVDKVL